MKGYPKHLNTREDYEYVLANFPYDEYQPSFQALIDTAYEWYDTGTVASVEDGVTDETHRVLSEENEGDTTYTQQEYRLNTNAKIFRLGYTIDEVQAILDAVAG